MMVDQIAHARLSRLTVWCCSWSWSKVVVVSFMFFSLLDRLFCLPSGRRDRVERTHTAESLAIAAGANVKAVKQMLGHASAAMTSDTYADLFDNDLDAVAIALEMAKRADSS